jgi:hypothetical protein
LKPIERGKLCSLPNTGVCSLPHTLSSRRKDRGAFESAGAQISKRLVGLLQRVNGGFGGNTHLGYEAQKIDAILAGEFATRRTSIWSSPRAGERSEKSSRPI